MHDLLSVALSLFWSQVFFHSLTIKKPIFENKYLFTLNIKIMKINNKSNNIKNKTLNFE